ncbi:hypothetical protein AR9_g284 [Bacillus phage AR9]|uniref:Uncharacterized protein n=2 Tax=Bacillus phage PBS1 TaxID=10683 RepID=A0A172JIK0_BPPB1|nr:hypothetical protein BI022_gp283 [Bacillus phage AR9]YP_009664378.1 hypothetical protein FK780_gp270 [Bacillus phage PBS1]AMS01368.1 hypothetical protein AR9_g284 [Bacillus phage AR9]AST99998.1 hypothetical protein PBI_PBS1_177 [Bacillus phage PBS1]BDE75487.1 hypothetical protein [Bacillus phage PBS1]
MMKKVSFSHRLNSMLSHIPYMLTERNGIRKVILVTDDTIQKNISKLRRNTIISMCINSSDNVLIEYENNKENRKIYIPVEGKSLMKSFNLGIYSKIQDYNELIGIADARKLYKIISSKLLPNRYINDLIAIEKSVFKTRDIIDEIS